MLLCLPNLDQRITECERVSGRGVFRPPFSLPLKDSHPLFPFAHGATFARLLIALITHLLLRRTVMHRNIETS
jgi:hypothetical protein